jgi:aerobic-type carbon monoxide dehydrogenase small subunit (CoxS/CutS family)
MSQQQVQLRMDRTITFTLNGQSRTVTTDAERSLLEVLREEFHLTGTKYGCGAGDCRACTVLVGGRAVTSCLTSIARVDKQSVQTIEGLATGDKLHPVQEAFLAENAFQCGYCTPGLILSVVGLLKENPRPSEAQIQDRLQLHLCRCCGYPNILKAVRRATSRPGG